MLKYPRRLLSLKAIVAYIIIGLVALNQFVGTVANIDFVLTASGNSRLVSFFNFLASPAGNLCAIVAVAIWLTALLLWPASHPPPMSAAANREQSNQNERSLSTRQQRRITTKTVEVEPNIQALKAEYLLVENRDGLIVRADLSRINSRSTVFFSSIIPLINRLPDSDKEIGEVDGVAARILYRPYDIDLSSLEINRAAWFSEDESRVFFGKNDTHCLIAATVEGDTEPVVYALKRDVGGTRQGRETRRVLLEGDLISATITLFAEEEGKAIFKREFIMEISRQKQELKISEAGQWRTSALMSFVREGMAIRTYDKEPDEKDAEGWFIRSRGWVKQQLGATTAKRLGLTRAEYDAQPNFAKALSPWSTGDRLSKNIETLLNLASEQLKGQIKSKGDESR